MDDVGSGEGWDDTPLEALGDTMARVCGAWEGRRMETQKRGGQQIFFDTGESRDREAKQNVDRTHRVLRGGDGNGRSGQGPTTAAVTAT